MVKIKQNRTQEYLDKAILSFLRRGTTVTAHGLQLWAQPKSCDRTCRAIRASIKRLNDLGYPIVSTTGGFHLAESNAEIAWYRDNLIRRAQRIMDRVQALDYVSVNGQDALALGTA